MPASRSRPGSPRPGRRAVLTPAKRILPAFLASRCASSSSSVTSAARSCACRYQMSRWSVPSSFRLVSSSASASALVRAPGLAGDEDVVAAALERRAHHALVVAALVAARGVEVVDAEVGGALDHAVVGGDHAAEADLGHLEARPSEPALANRRRRGRFGQCRPRYRRRGRVAGRGHGHSASGERGGCQELTAGAAAGHERHLRSARTTRVWLPPAPAAMDRSIPLGRRAGAPAPIE